MNDRIRPDRTHETQETNPITDSGSMHRTMFEDSRRMEDDGTPMRVFLQQLPGPVRIIFYVLTTIMAGMGLFALIK